MLSAVHVQMDCLDRARAVKRARKPHAPKILARAETRVRKLLSVAITFVRNAVIAAIVVPASKSWRKNVAADCIPKSCRAQNRIYVKRNANEFGIAISIHAIER